jgi:hypothetical protein
MSTWPVMSTRFDGEGATGGDGAALLEGDAALGSLGDGAALLDNGGAA